ncbi:MAG: hypothetical protein AAB839_03055 [Patescibacteria group bacterium]
MRQPNRETLARIAQFAGRKGEQPKDTGLDSGTKGVDEQTVVEWMGQKGAESLLSGRPALAPREESAPSLRSPKIFDEPVIVDQRELGQ